MNRKTLSILLTILMLLNVALAVLTPLILPAVKATITGRPVIYYDNEAPDPVEVPAGDSVSIDLSGMTITGAQVWLWISKSGGAVIEPGDKWIVGPFYVGDIVGPGRRTYTFVPGVNLTTPWSLEGRTYTFTVGNNWINGTMPLLVEGGVYYWLKITDVDPRLGTSIPSSDVAVSTNRIVFTPSFTATPPDGSDVAPNTPITVRGYALPLDQKYNVTQDNQVVASLLSPAKKTAYGWDYTELEVTFPALDLELKYAAGVSPGTITVNVIENATGTTMAIFTYNQPPREVYIPRPVQDDLRKHGGDYSNELILETGGEYNVTLNWFPYRGSVNIYLNNTLVASNVGPLNETGGILNHTIKIPNLRTGRYLFRVVDNNGVEYNFTVGVSMVPFIEVVPREGYVGDTVTVLGHNFLDYVGQYITIYFETCGGRYELLANFTTPGSEWSYSIVVPVAPGGSRAVQVRDASGTSTIASTTFRVLPRITVEPSTFASNYTDLIRVTGLGFEADATVQVNVDNTYAGQAQCDECGNLTVLLVGGGFRPGLHVVAVYDSLLSELLAYAHFTVTEVGDAIVSKIETSTGAMLARLEELNAVITDVNNNVATIKSDIGVIKADVSAIKSLVESGNAVLTGIQGDVAVIKTTVSDVKTSVGTILARLEVLNAVVTIIQDGVARIQTSIGTIAANVSTIRSIVEKSNAMLVDVKDGIAVIKTDVGTIKADVSAIRPVIISVGDDVATIKTEIGNVKASIDALKPVVTSINGTVATVNTTLGDVQGTVVTIKGNVATIMTDVGVIKADVSTMKSGVADVKGGVSTVSTMVIIAVVLSVVAAATSIYSVIALRRALVH